MNQKLIVKTLYIFVSLIIFSSANPAPAKHPTYIIGVEDTDYFPHYTTQNSKYLGFARELFDQFGQHAGIKFEYYPFPVKRLFKEFVEETIDFKYPDNPRWQVDIKNDKKVIYSDKIVNYMSGAVVLPENLGKGIDQIRILGVVRGFTPLPFMEEINSGKMETFENRDFPGVLRQTLSGRVDAAYVNLSVANYQLGTTFKKPNALIFDMTLPHLKSYFSLSTIKRPEVIESFNRFMDANRQEISALKIKYSVGFEEDL